MFCACEGPQACLALRLFIANTAAQAYLTLRRSVHAHVIFWIHDDDAEEACSKIRSCMPAEWNPEGDGGLDANKERITGAWIPPTERLHLRLFRAAKRKERHECKPVGQPGCRQKGADCAGHFPQPVQSEKAPLEDPDNFCFRYYCPGHEHRNVVPYVPVRPACVFPPACFLAVPAPYLAAVQPAPPLFAPSQELLMLFMLCPLPCFIAAPAACFGCSATSSAPVPTLPGAADALQFSSEHAKGD